MKTTALRLYAPMDVRLDTFDLPEITDDEVLLRIVTDSLCPSTLKAVKQGSAHKRVPDDIAENPVIIGHEMCGEIVKVGKNLQAQWKVDQRVVIQPALKLDTNYDIGYAYRYIGGDATYVIVPKIALDRGCMLPFGGEAFFSGSLVEALGCIVRGYKGLYHTDYSNYVRTDGAKKGGKLAILAGAGPMGIGTVEIAMGYAGVKQIVVTDINGERLAEAAKKCPPEKAKARGVELIYVDTTKFDDPTAKLREISGGGFDDVFVMAPVPALFTMAEAVCGTDGCVNFFTGPTVHDLQGSLNLYRIHYDGIHIVGTAGSIPEDTVDTIRLIEDGAIETGALVSHILGLRDAKDATFALDKPSGAKKVCYPGLDIPMTAIADFAERGKTDPMYAELDRIVKKNGGLWCAEAEKYLLAHAPKLA